ncbi:UxaA family hydrolase [Alkalihalobacillus sp. AL-G]|uniref:UxaA family hydrolase n=1 Tax=Alkalihalobacillus sp. AL-G TaxID=2926399 RepID=UPI00272AD4A8|nr:UxaA family hydrolase [Alkalihalobacillus sp. AL-G]WLD93846.1 UxaA family hydrolase [Alkalihalobacillus sp. AL-G]
MAKRQTLMMKPIDNVAVALTPIKKDTVLQVTCQDKTFSVVLQDDIDFGHKFAVVTIQKEQDVRKYGEVIGVASSEIQAGEHVHIHNVEGKRGRGDKVGREHNATHGI